jgi:hypothetical protein
MFGSLYCLTRPNLEVEIQDRVGFAPSSLEKS